MKIKNIIKVLLAIFIVIFIVNIILYSSSGNYAAVIRIDGIINDAKANEWIETLNGARNDPNCKGILIKVNSPGGGACASERLYGVIKKINAVKPVVVLIESVGASGGYFISCGAEKIVCYPTSITGSIGVIFETINISRLAKNLGISDFTIKSGDVKDVGNPFRKPTNKDRAMLQNVINSVYSEFFNVVSSSRHINPDILKKYADGSVFSGKEALQIGLVDSIGGESAAKSILRKKTKIQNINFRIINKKESVLRGIVGEKIFNIIDHLNILFTPKINTML